MTTGINPGLLCAHVFRHDGVEANGIVALAAEEERAAGAVNHVSSSHEPVGQCEERERDARQIGDASAAQQTTQEIARGPVERQSGTSEWSAANRLESPPEPPVSKLGKAGEIVRAFVHLLHERRLGIDDAIRLQYALDLRDDTQRLDDVLEDGLHADAIDAPVRKRDVVSVRDKLRELRWVDVEGDLPNLRVVVERFGPDPHRRAAHHEEEW